VPVPTGIGGKTLAVVVRGGVFTDHAGWRGDGWAIDCHGSVGVLDAELNRGAALVLCDETAGPRSERQAGD
jgi:hypothetical protein